MGVECVELVEASVPELWAWLRANEIEPNDTPVHASIDVDSSARTITVDQFVRVDGKLCLHGLDVLEHQVTFPLRAEPNSDVQPILDGLNSAARRAAVRNRTRGELLAELDAAGRLLPEGSEVRPEWQVLWTLTDGQTDEWGCETEAKALVLLLATPERAVEGVIRSRQHWSSPWTAVEPAEVSGG